jgi:hypothetical protein
VAKELVGAVDEVNGQRRWSFSRNGTPSVIHFGAGAPLR